MDRDPLLTEEEEREQRRVPPPWVGALIYVSGVTLGGIGGAMILEYPIEQGAVASWVFGTLWKVCILGELN